MRHDYMVKQCSYCCSDTIHYTYGRHKKGKYCIASYRCAVCGTSGEYHLFEHPKLIFVSKE